jgi:DNA mismatch repair protein MutS2
LSLFHLDRLDFGLLLERIAAGCCTPRGRRRLIGLQPAPDLPSLERRQAVAAELARLGTGEDRVPLEILPEVDPLIALLAHSGTRLDGPQLWDLRSVLHGLEVLSAWLGRSGRGRLEAFLTHHGAPARYQEELDALEAALAPGGEVRDEASPELARLRRRLRGLEERWRARAQELAAAWYAQGLAQEAEPTLRQGRFVVAVRAEQRSRVPGVAVDRSRTGQTFFIEPLELSDLFLELRETIELEEQEVAHILAGLTALCAARAAELDADLDRLAVLDAAQAAAGFEEAGPTSLPEVVASGDLRLLLARHPLLGGRLGWDRVVPLTLELDSARRTLVISGPNSGGKTVALQTVGLCAALALCGLPIPAAEGSRLPFLAAVLVDIGDEQSLAADLSTFTAHVQRLKAMLAPPEGARLCLIDEAGAGTDPAQGAALAIAVLEALTAEGAWTVCTTHNGRIKEHAAATPGMLNGSMVFSNQSLTPTYEFHPGTPGRSFAFEIAQRAGLPGEVVTRARGLLDPAARRLDEVLSESEERLESLRRREQEAEIEQRRALAEHQRWQKLADELSADAARRRAQAARETESLVVQARRRIEAAVRQIREEQASRGSIRRARQTLREVTAETEALVPAVPVCAPGWSPSAGERVWIRPLERAAVVQSVSGRRVRVESSGLSLEVGPDDLRPLTEREREDGSVPLRRSGGVRAPLKSVPERLELIGYRAEQARQRLEKYLDDALLVGLDGVSIVHGVGSGVLRRVVEEVLGTHPEVAEYGLDRGSPGGYGVTLVRFRGSEP